MNVKDHLQQEKYAIKDKLQSAVFWTCVCQLLENNKTNKYSLLINLGLNTNYNYH